MGIQRLLQERKLVVGDGAMGTQLMAKGLEAGACCELWNLEKPDIVASIHRGYVEAGSDCILTNTFGANAVALKRHRLEARIEEINAAGAQVARKAAGTKAVVFGDLGPTGAILEPIGALTRDEAASAFSRQVSALARAGVDAIIAETFDSVEELDVALTAARQACELPLVASMKFQKEPSGRYRTMMGDSPEDLVDVARRRQCAIVGTNCGSGIKQMVELVGRISDMTELPVMVQPNAGSPRLVEGRTVYEEDVATFEEYLPQLYERGARIIGGCCGTSTEHVRAIRRLADALSGRAGSDGDEAPEVIAGSSL